MIGKVVDSLELVETSKTAVGLERMGTISGVTVVEDVDSVELVETGKISPLDRMGTISGVTWLEDEGMTDCALDGTGL